MEGGAFDALVADIAENGIRDPLVSYEDMLLDGRNRYRAAEKAGVTITGRLVKPFNPDKDGDPLAWVISKNLHRRHLNESQRAMVAARVATLKHGGNQWSGQLAAPTQEQAAAMLNVGERSIRRARLVIDHGSAELAALVDQALADVETARRNQSSAEAQTARLRAEAPDLADLVAEERMKLSDGIAA
ncbi:hypothetical protein ACQR09_23000 [Bradyrhizobium oligotrophicum]|uniref:hypothetical protein n=1 Tax=Bradyrhizobium oligotrophicum TaxID=44255 RepID=UPI003EBBF6E1